MELNVVQVSMNLTDYTQTPIHRADGGHPPEAARYGVPVVGSELVGPCSARSALDEGALLPATPRLLFCQDH